MESVKKVLLKPFKYVRQTKERFLYFLWQAGGLSAVYHLPGSQLLVGSMWSTPGWEFWICKHLQGSWGKAGLFLGCCRERREERSGSASLPLEELNFNGYLLMEGRQTSLKALGFSFLCVVTAALLGTGLQSCNTWELVQHSNQGPDCSACVTKVKGTKAVLC